MSTTDEPSDSLTAAQSKTSIPETKVRPANARSADIRREAAFCDCGMQKSVTGVCSSCD
jgi:hypothetical protein